MMEDEKRALVVGRQIFVDLWALEGFEKIVCEDPSSFRCMMEKVLDNKIGIVIMEETWIEDLPIVVRKKLENLQEPVIVMFPSVADLLMGGVDIG
jgi:vacuolar-type H+-ATPase subunit F/Vma7